MDLYRKSRWYSYVHAFIVALHVKLSPLSITLQVLDDCSDLGKRLGRMELLGEAHVDLDRRVLKETQLLL